MRRKGKDMNDERLHRVWLLLKITFGLVPIAAGLDKFLGLLADWESYLGPVARSLLPLDPGTFLKIVGVIEIAAGALVLSRYTRVGAYVVSAWLVAIALQLLTTGHFLDVAVRDLVMAASAFSLARLDALRAPQGAAARAAGVGAPAPAGASRVT
jgi:uncharacterized membrane protein YphA (DoxX/SURF4 family)